MPIEEDPGELEDLDDDFVEEEGDEELLARALVPWKSAPTRRVINLDTAANERVSILHERTMKERPGGRNHGRVRRVNPEGGEGSGGKSRLGGTKISQRDHEWSLTGEGMKWIRQYDKWAFERWEREQRRKREDLLGGAERLELYRAALQKRRGRTAADLALIEKLKTALATIDFRHGEKVVYADLLGISRETLRKLLPSRGTMENLA